jgi:hypothetical protein
LHKRGSQRGLHLDSLPLWGREGVILQVAAESKWVEKKRGFQKSHNSESIYLLKLVYRGDHFTRIFINKLPGGL